jgi:hypothetical protein
VVFLQRWKIGTNPVTKTLVIDGQSSGMLFV